MQVFVRISRQCALYTGILFSTCLVMCDSLHNHWSAIFVVMTLQVGLRSLRLLRMRKISQVPSAIRKDLEDEWLRDVPLPQFLKAKKRRKCVSPVTKEAPPIAPFCITTSPGWNPYEPCPKTTTKFYVMCLLLSESLELTSQQM